MAGNQPLTVPVGYAHRGYSPDGVENSLAAFAAAVALGYRHLETDARVTADGVALAFHDVLLDRVTNHTGRLDRLTWEQVAQARIRGREPIPRLVEVLDAFGDVEVNIDVKSDAAVGPALDAVRQARAWHRVRLASFSDRRCRLLRQAAGPAVATALSPRETAVLRAAAGRPAQVLAPVLAPLLGPLPDRLRTGWDRLSGQDLLMRLPPDSAAQVPAGPARAPLVTAAFVAEAHRRGIAVHVWTINDRAGMIRLLDLGVDGIITDRADLLRDVLRERGQWPS